MALTVTRGTWRRSPARLGQIAGAVAAQPDRWRDVLRFDAVRRWYVRLELADDYEVWLLTWLPGQSTGFHDHGNAAGAFAVARGPASERPVAALGHRARPRPVPAGRPNTCRPRPSQHATNIPAHT